MCQTYICFTDNNGNRSIILPQKRHRLMAHRSSARFDFSCLSFILQPSSVMNNCRDSTWLLISSCQATISVAIALTSFLCRSEQMIALWGISGDQHMPVLECGWRWVLRCMSFRNDKRTASSKQLHKVGQRIFTYYCTRNAPLKHNEQREHNVSQNSLILL